MRIKLCNTKTTLHPLIAAGMQTIPFTAFSVEASLNNRMTSKENSDSAFIGSFYLVQLCPGPKLTVSSFLYLKNDEPAIIEIDAQ